MLRFIYRHYRGCIVTSALLFIGLFVRFNLSILVFYPLCFCCFAFILAAASLYSRQVARAYTERCDPEPYLEMALFDIRRFQKAHLPSTRAALANAYLSAVSALSGLGRYEEAVAYLDTLDPSALNPYAQIVGHHDRFSLLLYLEREPVELERLLALAEDSANTSRLSNRQREVLHRVLSYDRTLLQIQKDGPTDEAVSQLALLLPTMAEEYQRVYCHMALAQCTWARRDKDAAREHLDYVLAHGNKLYAHAKALELLDKLNSEDTAP